MKLLGKAAYQTQTLMRREISVFINNMAPSLNKCFTLINSRTEYECVKKSITNQICLKSAAAEESLTKNRFMVAKQP